MRVGLMISTVAAAAAVAGCAVMVAVMGTAATTGTATNDAKQPVADAGSSIPLMLTQPASATRSASSSASIPGIGSPSVSASLSASASPASPMPTSSTSAISSSASSSAPPASSARTTPPAPAPSTSKPKPPPTVTVPAPVQGGALPLGYSTGTATRVITVVSSGYSHTTATLQAWNKAPGGGWLKYGPAITAHVGSQGMTTSPSESKSATPIGSFTLTQAFGHLADPGTGLPYFQTSPSDWWISQSGSLYNTHQHCSSSCAFAQGSPNEHLYYETPFYNYAVVIDYNTRNAPGGVRQGAGSAFFLHVTDGSATAGCVAIPSSNLVTIMRWLTPSTHPRILIGVT